MAAPAHDAPNGRRPALERYGGLLFTLAGLLLGAALFALIPALRHSVSLSANGNLSGLRDYIRDLHLGGLLLLFALILMHAVIPYPSEILTSTAGFVYGFIPGFLFALVGWTATALLTYGIGRTVGRPLLRTVLGRRFSDLEQGMDRGGVRLMLVSRLLPVVPMALIGYAAGATGASLWRLTWTSFIGYIPLTLLVAYLGSQAKNLSASNPLVWIAVAVVILLIVGPHLWSRRAARRTAAEPGD